MRESTKTRVDAIRPRVAAILAPMLLLAIGIGHIIWHDKVALDWQATTLLIAGVVLWFLPLREIAAKLSKVKIGNFEFELQKEREDLSKKVADAEAEAATTEFADKVVESADAAPTRKVSSDHLSSTGNDEAVGPTLSRPNLESWAKKPRHYRVDFDEVTALRYEVDQLRGISPTAGLIRLAAAIEQAVITMATPLKPPQKQRVSSFSMGLDLLLRKEKVSARLAQALSQFWHLRNRIAHQSAPMDDDAVTNAIDDGFRLLLLLNSM